MPRLLRVTNERCWDFVEEIDVWRQKNDLPAAPLGDLKPSATGKLSMWLIEDGDANLDRVLAAIAAKRTKIEKLEARLIDVALVERLAITFEKSRGDTKDREANRSWHVDLTNLTLRQLEQLAMALATEAEPIDRSDDEVTDLIVTAVRANHIHLDELKPPPNVPGPKSVWTVISAALAEAPRNGESAET